MCNWIFCLNLTKPGGARRLLSSLTFFNKWRSSAENIIGKLLVCVSTGLGGGGGAGRVFLSSVWAVDRLSCFTLWSLLSSTSLFKVPFSRFWYSLSILLFLPSKSPSKEPFSKECVWVKIKCQLQTADKSRGNKLLTCSHFSSSMQLLFKSHSYFALFFGNKLFLSTPTKTIDMTRCTCSSSSRAKPMLDFLEGCGGEADGEME